MNGGRHVLTEPPPVARKVVEEVFPFPAGGGPGQGYAVTIQPSAVPEGDSILIQVTRSPGMVMSTTRAPACRPAF
ncbi:MAG TPA: hypothetical protein VFW50_19370 [Streptosporangiaceae bacterium]|nr:hypothetical protein [Streptosporangiaceae bacterium]